MNKISVFKKDFLSVGVLKILNLFFKLLNSVIFVQILGLSGRGEYFKFIQVSGVIGFFICLSLGDYLLFQVNQKKNNQSFIDFFKFYLYSYIILYVVSFFVLESNIRIWLLFIFSGSVEYLLLSFFKSERKYHTVSWFLFFKNLLIILTIIVLSKSIALLDIFYIINYLNFFLVLIFSYWNNLFSGSYFKGIERMKELVNYAKYVHLNNIFNDFEDKADILIISFFMSDQQIGIYSIIVVIAQSINHLTNFLVQIISPNLKLVSMDNFKNILQLTLFFGIMYFISILIFGENILFYLYSIVEKEVWYFTLILLIGVVFENITKVYLTFFKFSKNYSIIGKIAIYTALINIIFNLIFIPIYGIFGAVMVSLITYTIRFIYFHFQYISHNKITNNFFIFPDKKLLLLVLKKGYSYIYK